MPGLAWRRGGVSPPDANALAAVTYRAAAEAARRAEIAPLGAQALRMASMCLQRLGRDDDANAARSEAERLDEATAAVAPQA